MTPFFLFPRDDSNQRTSHALVQSECVHTSAVKSSLLHVYTAPSLSQQHRRGLHRVRVQVQVHNHEQPRAPRPVSCHVPRLLNTNSDPLLHASYCEYRPTTRSTHVETHVIFHNDTAPSEGNPHCPLIQRRDSPCHSLPSPLLKPSRLFPVLGEIE